MIATKSEPPSDQPEGHAITLDALREFHRRMAAMIEAVQTGIWERKLYDLLGYATDYGFVAATRGADSGPEDKERSSYVRLHWDTVMGDGGAEKHAVETAIARAITELS